MWEKKINFCCPLTSVWAPSHVCIPSHTMHLGTCNNDKCCKNRPWTEFSVEAEVCWVCCLLFYCWDKGVDQKLLQKERVCFNSVFPRAWEQWGRVWARWQEQKAAWPHFHLHTGNIGKPENVARLQTLKICPQRCNSSSKALPPQMLSPSGGQNFKHMSLWETFHI